MLKFGKDIGALHRYSVTVKFPLLTCTEIVSYIIYLYIYYKRIFLHIQVSYFQL